MRPGQNKRSRGRNGGGGGGGPHYNRPRLPQRVQTFDSNGPSVKIRGNAYQVFERYVALAREAHASGGAGFVADKDVGGQVKPGHGDYSHASAGLGLRRRTVRVVRPKARPSASRRRCTASPVNKLPVGGNSRTRPGSSRARRTWSNSSSAPPHSV